ncbi:MAG: 50S ribosomal protein L21 [Patescibacteria group bacterium]|nr:50S ribosomal protein L21 [Patescibacteria group bacterium]
MFAIIETGGKQYKVEPGGKLKTEKLPGSSGDKVSFDKVLLFSDGSDVKVGVPYLEKAKVEGVVLRQARSRKQIVFHYHSKTRKRTKNTHRQNFTEVQIEKITA